MWRACVCFSAAILFPAFSGTVTFEPSGTVTFGDWTAAIADINAGRRTTPLVGEPSGGGDHTVTFLVKRVAGVPRIVSDVTGWGEGLDRIFDVNAGRMTRVGRTAWYVLQAKVAPRARIEYLVAHGATDYRLDPNNPRQAGGPHTDRLHASEFVTPGYLPPPEFADGALSSTGTVSTVTVESTSLGAPCSLAIYTPSGYRADGDYPLAVFLDGRSALVSRVLDWSIAREAMPPIVAVFVMPKPGEVEPARLRAFVAGELLAWIRSHYAVSASTSRRAIFGLSYGAKDATEAALASPDAYGLLGLLLPGRRMARGDIATITESRAHRLRVAILAGQYDLLNLPTARAARQAFVDAGDAVDYIEVPEGHSPVTWVHHLKGVLLSLFAYARSPTPPRGVI